MSKFHPKLVVKTDMLSATPMADNMLSATANQDTTRPHTNILFPHLAHINLALISAL